MIRSRVRGPFAGLLCLGLQRVDIPEGLDTIAASEFIDRSIVGSAKAVARDEIELTVQGRL